MRVKLFFINSLRQKYYSSLKISVKVAPLKQRRVKRFLVFEYRLEWVPPKDELLQEHLSNMLTWPFFESVEYEILKTN